MITQSREVLVGRNCKNFSAIETVIRGVVAFPKGLVAKRLALKRKLGAAAVGISNFGQENDTRSDSLLVFPLDIRLAGGINYAIPVRVGTYIGF
ncbi:hypothetical protein ColTof3_01854 [Colletotrichum tofieldiae]|nr:hypothetical protein ColTof3_01854 [Colletotrichum tofieldiae]